VTDVIRISTPLAEAEIHQSGAHLTQWTPRGQRPVLFLSPRSLFTPGKAIRGGVPVIFPWFGPRSDGKAGVAHGFARTMEWTKESERALDDGRVEVGMGLSANDETRAVFDASFHVRFRVRIGAQLEMTIETTNDGPYPFAFEEALHTYLAVGDVRQTTVSGLEGTTYIDKAVGLRRKTLGKRPIAFHKEVDQMHIHTDATCVLHDPVWNRRIVIEKSGSLSTVVWNPWIERTSAMSDMAPESWMGMVCVETANASENAIKLPAGATHRMTATIRVEPGLQIR
jgi:glucose-6-phosphate 1-epimerase